MINISYKGTAEGLMKYIASLVEEEEGDKGSWTDRSEYDKDGIPNE